MRCVRSIYIEAMKNIAWVVVVVAACGGTKTKMDAPGGATVQAVDCAANPPNATVTVVSTPTLGYSPQMTTISVGQVVEFMMPSAHNVASATPGLAVDFGQTACLQFSTAGTYDFHCSVHLFAGSVKVQ